MRTRKLRVIAGGALLAFGVGVSGCATLRENPAACKAVAGLTGGTLGAVGGGVGTHNIENGPTTDGQVAAGAAAGLVVGSLIGFGIGHFVCKEPEAPPPPPPPPPAPAAPRKIETLSGPHFDFDKATIRPSGKEKLDRVAKTMQDNPSMRILAEGHTDSIGSDAYNLRLSERRAESVKSYLVEKGVSPSRITTKGLGKSDPVASNATEEGRAQNRRVDIIAQ